MPARKKATEKMKDEAKFQREAVLLRQKEKKGIKLTKPEADKG